MATYLESLPGQWRRLLARITPTRRQLILAALLVSLLPLIRLSLPTRVEALRRLERNANVKHRPASSYEDRLGATPRRGTLSSS